MEINVIGAENGCMVESLFEWLCCCLHQLQGPLEVLALLAGPPLPPPTTHKTISVEVTYPHTVALLLKVGFSFLGKCFYVISQFPPKTSFSEQIVRRSRETILLYMILRVMMHKEGLYGF